MLLGIRKAVHIREERNKKREKTLMAVIFENSATTIIERRYFVIAF